MVTLKVNIIFFQDTHNTLLVLDKQIHSLPNSGSCTVDHRWVCDVIQPPEGNMVSHVIISQTVNQLSELGVWVSHIGCIAFISGSDKPFDPGFSLLLLKAADYNLPGRSHRNM